jgi:hypothetical protein
MFATTARGASRQRSRRGPRKISKNDRNTLPVVDSEERLIGIVTIDDVLRHPRSGDDARMQVSGSGLDGPQHDPAAAHGAEARELAGDSFWANAPATAMGFFENEIEPWCSRSSCRPSSPAAATPAPSIHSYHSRDGTRRNKAARLVDGDAGSEERLDAQLDPRSLVFCASPFGRVLQYLRAALVIVGLTVGIALIGVVLWERSRARYCPFLLRRLCFDPTASSRRSSPRSSMSPGW